ncbi:MAG: SH3 domain-containing protein [Hyphomicrobiaceae bacterium]|nr:SH3 domain-containing protein [Hyphomicrobiaceae bacterium]
MSRYALLGLGVAASVLVAQAMPATAQRTGRCIVSDPTGTRLNVRNAPQGDVIGRLRNGTEVRIIDTARDHKGQPWAYVGYWRGGRIGWVFREFISCY